MRGGAPGGGAGGRAGGRCGAAQAVKPFLRVGPRHSDFAVGPAADLGEGWRRSPGEPSPKAADGRLPLRPGEAPLPRRRRVPELRVKRRRTSVPKLKSKAAVDKRLILL